MLAALLARTGGLIHRRAAAKQGRPASASAPALCETLERRQLLCASVTTAAADAGGLRANSLIAPLTAALARIKGNFSGKYTSTVTGKALSMTLHVAKYSHSGHFSGSITVATSSGNVTGVLSGSVRSNLHFTISFTISKYTGTFTGKTTRTGGHLKGSYTATNGDYGTFSVGKA